ncbi:MAG: NUDIX hydrolase [Bdellovibrionales bacterium]|nr:NUDIX hydrolase [Bdellovibrionales bacterium]
MEIVPYAAVNAAIFNQDRKILLTRRDPAIREGGKWCLPGGHLDGGEDWVSAIRREILEETGLVIKKQELAGIYSDPSLTVTESPLRHTGHYAQFLVALFIVTEWQGEVRQTKEVDAWDWFDAQTLPAPMIKSHPIRVHDSFQFNGTVFVR